MGEHDGGAGLALVTGGASGIGRAISLELGRRGYEVAALDRDEAALDETVALAEGAGLDVLPLVADLADRSSLSAALQGIEHRLPALHALVNNASVRPVGTIEDTTEEIWADTLDVNVGGPYRMTQLLLPHLVANKGCVVNLGSAAGSGRPGLFAYCVSKGALSIFTRALALDLAPHGIRVNTVVPGLTTTGVTHSDANPGFLDRAERHSVAHRPNDPVEVARAVAWLCSDEAATTSGVTLEIGTLPLYVH